MKKIKGHYDGKQIVLDEDVQLQPNTEVTVLVEENGEGDFNKPIGGKTDPLEIFGKAVDTGIEDFAEQHDHYLYGTPKRKAG